jgi:hypothetical protein
MQAMAFPRIRISGARMMAAVGIISASALHGQTLIDPGFESYSVSAGGFIQPASGSWTFVNDAGVVEPPSPNSSTGPLSTWSAIFPAVEGQQYASTYAGADIIRQFVTFGTAGDYRLGVYAAAPDGTVTIPSVGTFALGNGEFTFTLGNTAIGNLHSVSAGSSWSLFTADFTISTPGNYQLGVRNTAGAPYFINYDAFTVVPVPEPTFLGLSVALGIVIGARALAQRKRSVAVRRFNRSAFRE